jgi:predicted Zn-dependent protease
MRRSRSKVVVSAAIDSRNPKDYHVRSTELLGSGDQNGALLAALKAVELTLTQSPPNPWFVRHAMRIFVETNQPRLALMVYEHAVNQKADKYLLSLQHARALRILKRNDEAKASLKWALSNVTAGADGNEEKKIEGYLKFFS